MKSAKEIDGYIQQNILNGLKVENITSYPVIRQEDGVYYLAYFLVFYCSENIQNEEMFRPNVYALVDLETGKIIKRMVTPRNGEFSNASYDRYYNFKNDGIKEVTNLFDYYTHAFSILDEVRSKLINEHIFDEAKYKEYLNMILARIPADYQIFYYDLSV